MRIRDNIYWADFDDLLVVLDMESGKYFALNSEAGRVWRAVAQSTTLATNSNDNERFAAVCEALTSSGLIVGNEHPGKRRRQATSWTNSFLSSGLFAGAARGTHRLTVARRLQLFAKAYLILIAADVLLSSRGFHQVLLGLGGCASHGSQCRWQTDDAEKLCGIALEAFRWYRPQVACMHKALAVYLFLRAEGIQAELCVGVTVRPFASHTWAEYKGKVIGDSQGVCRGFNVIAKVA